MRCLECGSNMKQAGYRRSESTRERISKRYQCKSCGKTMSVPLEASRNNKLTVKNTGLDKETLDELKRLRDENKRLKETVNVYSRKTRQYVIDMDWTNSIAFGVIGDTHIGSLYERIDALNEFYQLCREEGITTIIHAGDVLDGHKMYRGHEFELYANGFDAQANAFAERAPGIDGIDTHFICGNHDASFKKQNGIDVGAELARRRADWHYYGFDYADITFRTKTGYEYRIRPVHPNGGTPYAISYRSQKIAEAISGGQKPNTLLIGHLHKADHLPCERNIQTIQTGCFQSQTPYIQRKPTPAHIGGWIVKATVNRDGLTSRFNTEFISFYEPAM